LSSFKRHPSISTTFLRPVSTDDMVDVTFMDAVAPAKTAKKDAIRVL